VWAWNIEKLGSLSYIGLKNRMTRLGGSVEEGMLSFLYRRTCIGLRDEKLNLGVNLTESYWSSVLELSP
jgi:hypothetical protein